MGIIDLSNGYIVSLIFFCIVFGTIFILRNIMVGKNEPEEIEEVKPMPTNTVASTVQEEIKPVLSVNAIENDDESKTIAVLTALIMLNGNGNNKNYVIDSVEQIR